MATGSSANRDVPATRESVPMTVYTTQRTSLGRRSLVRTWVVWLLVLVAATALMFAVRAHLDKAHIALGLLIVVLGGSAAGGRALGVSLALLAFVIFNFFFLAPYHTLAITNPLDWLVLGAFLITGIVAAHLLNRAQERAEAARQRAIEVKRLAALGSETLNAGRAEDALVAVAEVIRAAIGVACCEVLVPVDQTSRLAPLARAGSCASGGDAADATAPWSLAVWVAEKRQVAAERADGTKWIGTGERDDESLQWPPGGTGISSLLVPLIVRDRTVGVLRMSNATAFTLDPDREQFLSALSFYAALGVERVRLVADAERAEALRQGDTLKTALITGLSHDLRTPLTTIKALAHTLSEQGTSEAVRIEEETDRLNRLVADLLDLSRLNAGALPMRPELNAAEDLVGAAVRQAAGALGTRRVVVSTPDAASGPTETAVLAGRFDFVQALRALVNLIENAGKYSPPGEPIELGVTRAGAELRVVVADRGPGVSPDERDRIFEPFYRAPGAMADVGGAGLGLAIARRLAMEQGGDVRYAARPDGGSLFTLVLPAADDRVPNELELAPASQVSAARADFPSLSRPS